MYYKLAEHFALRGWKGLPYAVSDLRSGEIAFISQPVFQLLTLCDGETNFERVLLTSEQETALNLYCQAGVVKKTAAKERLLESQRYCAVENYFINGIHWSITGKCNLKCKHCYINAPDYQYHDLDTEQCRRIISQMKQANVTYVTLTGGEPLLRADFFELVDCLTQNEIAIRQIYTNGLLVDDQFLNKLSMRGLHPDFVLSYDCVGCHDWMRGVSGTEEKTKAAIKRIVAKGYDVLIETAIHKGNESALLKTYELLVEYGICKWKTSLVYETERWNHNGCTTDVSPENLYERYLEIIVANKNRGFPMAIQLDGFYSCQKDSGEYVIPYMRFDGTTQCLQKKSCMTCRAHPYLLPNGTLVPCPSMTEVLPFVAPNLTKTTLADIYSDLQSDFFRLANMKVGEIMKNNEECNCCEYRNICGGGCRAMAFFDHTGLYGKSLTNCYFFFNHYMDKIRLALEKNKAQQVSDEVIS